MSHPSPLSPIPDPLKNASKTPMYCFLIVLTVAAAVGLQGWRTLFNNFAVEIGQLNGSHIGLIQSVREIPGFLSLLAVYVILVMREFRLSILSILVMGIGVGVTGFFPSVWGLMITTLIMSFGFHYYETTNRSLTLQYFDKDVSPWVLGKQRSYSAAANIGVGVFILLFSSQLGYAASFGAVGAVVVLAAAWGYTQNPTNKQMLPQRKHMVLRRRYWLYYFLTFMAGARRQIFIAFAVFLMVARFEYTVQEVTLLFMANNVINYFLGPWIGKSIIHFGERRVLSLEYGCLIAVFAAYALVQTKWAVALLYVLDHLFFNFSIAIQTYFQKIGDPQDIAPTMAVGFTINHIAAVVLPVLGGLAWMVDYRIPFIIGAGLSLISLLAVQLIPTRIE